MAKLFVGLFFILFFQSFAQAKVKNIDGEVSLDPWADFIKGELRLDCNFPCSFKDGSQKPKYKAAYKGKNWKELFNLVVKSSHVVNLNYYYLGSVAEGIGEVNLAITYYRIALGHSLRCSWTLGTCNGVKVRKESKVKIAELKLKLAELEIAEPEGSEHSIAAAPFPAKQSIEAHPVTPKVVEIVPIEFDGSGSWEITVNTDPITDEQIVTALIRSEEFADSYRDKTAMLIRCDDGKIDIFVSFDDYLGSDYISTVSRLDKEKPSTDLWSLSTDNQAAFYPNSTKQLLKKLFAAKRFVVRATPYNENPKTLIFDVKGIYNALKPHENTCEW